MFRWLTERRRRAILAAPFPDAWWQIALRNVAHVRHLDPAEQEHLRQLTQVFLAEKHFEGCGGLTLTDEIRVTIAAQACLLLLGREHDLYAGVDTLLVYPSAVVSPERAAPLLGRNPLSPARGATHVLGEAHLRGPVILSWDDVLRGARHAKDGRNLVFHELAHKIDMLDGAPDGTPPLETRRAVQSWIDACAPAFLALRERAERGKKTMLDPYGATNEAEFFAVATEAFFERPIELRDAEPDVYAVLAEFYAQDPAARVARKGS